MSEKYGFVYIWFDRKYKRYYIGCRWGTEDDGYICSSKWMKDSYKRRPQDFKRRILKIIYSSRKELLDEEYKWLQLIKNDELGKKYYNLHNHQFNHWSSDPEKLHKITEQRKQFRHTEETKKKISETGKGKTPWNKGKQTGPLSEETKNKLSQNLKGKKFSDEHIQHLKESASKKDYNLLQNVIREKSMEKYGVEHHFSSELIKDKIKNTFIEKYGVENVYDIPHVKEAKKKLNIGKIWIKHSEHGQKRIFKEELDNYIENGWIRGLNNK